MIPRPLFFLLALLLAGCGPKPARKDQPIRVAVIGGMVMTGLWQDLAVQFEKDTGRRIELVATGPKEVIVPVFRKGEADLITFHSSDEATALVADGLGHNMRPWTWNEHVIIGPADDPAGISGMKDGAAALRKIAETESPFIDAQGGGKRLVAEKIWQKAGIRPVGPWVIKDESQSSTELLAFAQRKHAYAICGRIPILWKKIPGSGMKIMVEGDPDMRRPFVVIEADPRRFPGANHEGAKILADYLTGEKGRQFLTTFQPKEAGALPAFYPLSSQK